MSVTILCYISYRFLHKYSINYNRVLGLELKIEPHVQVPILQYNDLLLVVTIPVVARTGFSNKIITLHYFRKHLST